MCNVDEVNDASGQAVDSAFPMDLFGLSLRTQPLWESLSAVAGYELPTKSRGRFVEVHGALTQTPRLDSLARLEPRTEGRPDWLRRLTSKILDNVQEGVGACHYHLETIRAVEGELHSRARSEVARLELSATSNFAAAGGNTRRLNYEYQAFLLATRRTLEYFAGSVAAFFKANDPGLRSLSNSIATSQPPEERERVLRVLERNASLIEELLSQHPRITVRDRVAHWEPVQAGTFNLICIPDANPPFQLGLMGGGEELVAFCPVDLDPQLTLSDALGGVLEEIELLIFESYQALGLTIRD